MSKGYMPNRKKKIVFKNETKKGGFTYEQHVAKHTKKENTYNKDCPYC